MTQKYQQMKKLLTSSLVIATMMMTNAANAAIPLLNYKCAGR
ncbi:hypothetical protein [Gloeothece verrucosa]|nr:hypothetical protein [Gloeothece verrucosa]